MLKKAIPSKAARDKRPASMRMTRVTQTVKAFCQQRGLLRGLQDTVDLIQEHFHLTSPPSLAVETDPDTGDQWLELGVAAHGSIEEIAEARLRYNRAWHASAPPKVKENIRLFLHIATV